MPEMTAYELAAASARAMAAGDRASERLGIVLEHIAPGEATVSMLVTEDMANGHGTGHGGFTFTLADAAFAYACNSYNQRAVAHHSSITYVAPVSVGDRLTATARENMRTGHSGVYDVRVVNQNGEHVAEFRGHSRTVRGTHLPGVS